MPTPDLPFSIVNAMPFCRCEGVITEPGLLGIERFPGTDTVRNLFARFRQCHIDEFWRPLWKWLLTLSWPVAAQGFSLDLDSTIFQRNGPQEGAECDCPHVQFDKGEHRTATAALELPNLIRMKCQSVVRFRATDS